MSTQSIIKISVITALTALLSTGCSGAPSGKNEAHMTPANTDYVKTAKPGAAVTFQNISDQAASQDTSGNSRDVRVRISEEYSSGLLTVRVIDNPNLSVSGAGTYTFDMSGDAPHEIVLSVKPLADGKHYLNFSAVADYEGGQSARAGYAVTIYSGVQPQKADAAIAGEAQTGAEPRGLIVMDAEETIEPKTP